jgi:hypothetical protein
MVLASITRYHKLGLKQQKFIFSLFWRLKSKSKAVAGFVFSEVSLLDLKMAALWLPLHMVTPLCIHSTGLSVCTKFPFL